MIGDSSPYEIGHLRVSVLDLARLIRAKEYANRPKDIAVLPILRATLNELTHRKG